MAATKDKKQFNFTEITSDMLAEKHHIDLPKLFEQSQNELSLQQSKRDHIITLFISVFSLLLPLALSLEGITSLTKGLIFLSIGIIGVLFSMIIIRYRIYKEVYWLCCQTITCMMSIEQDKLNKSVIQSLFYRSLNKKGRGYVAKKKGGKKWRYCKYFRKNIFSSETLHFLIVDIMTSVLIGLGFFLILPLETWLSVLLAVLLALFTFNTLLFLYFKFCQEVYAVLINDKDYSFNKTFSKAWFLHLYVETDKADEADKADK